MPNPRFWSKVNKDGPVPSHRPELGSCWVWTGSVDRDGYGKFNGGRAHRFSAELSVMGIDGLLVCHHCDNPSCVNPSHLFVGTHSDNHRDRNRKGRQASGARNGATTRPDRVRRGVENGRSKLSEPDVLAIRQAAGSKSQQKIAADFGVSQALVSQLLRSKICAHV